MRYMIIIRADERSEAGAVSEGAELAAMNAYNEELARAGVLLAGEGLYPSDQGFRLRYTDGAPAVVDGPFTETKELIAGFWLIEVRSREEAVAWATRIPVPGDGELIEVRRVHEFG